VLFCQPSATLRKGALFPFSLFLFTLTQDAFSLVQQFTRLVLPLDQLRRPYCLSLVVEERE
jgi:hypothetical protein